MLKDSLDRKIDYLRVSVTEQCNLKCVYCVPKNYVPSLLALDALTDKEIVKAASLFSSLGVTSIRITGGEPLVRPGLCDLIYNIKKVPGIDDISLTTNGIFLEKLSPSLKEAGLNRINISLDTLNPSRFKLITGSNSLKNVLGGIEAAIEADLSPVKINVVLFRGINDTEIKDFVQLTHERAIHLRFIEAMPMGGTELSFRKRRINSDMILREVSTLQPLSANLYPQGKGPASYYALPKAKGTVGFINAVSNHFCSTCNRVRLSSKGKVFPCLDSKQGVCIKEMLREDSRESDVKGLLKNIVRSKPAMHNMVGRSTQQRSDLLPMCHIGG